MKVCIISESAYPTSSGGVSEWCHSLISCMKDVEFNLFSFSIDDELIYEIPSNMDRVIIERLHSPDFERGINERHAKDIMEELSVALKGEPLNCEKILEIQKNRGCTAEELLGSNTNWNSAVSYYEEHFHLRAFAPFYVFWTSLFYLLYKTLESVPKVPRSDVYHSLNAGYAGILGSLCKLNAEGSLIVTEHGLYLKERLFELENSEIPTWLHGMYEKFFESLVRTSYQYSDKVTSVCLDHTRFQRKVDPRLEDVEVIYNGIDTGKFQSSLFDFNDEEPYRIGTVTRITPIKDILTFIRAARFVLQRHRAKFYVVGGVEDEEYFEECQEVAKKLGIESQVEFTGYQDSLEWYPRFDVFALPSLSEGFPLSILEAMSFRVPCIATCVGGIPEILDDEFLVQKWDPEGLANKICWLLDDPKVRRRAGNEGRALIESKFSLPRMVRQYRKLYEAIA